MVAGSATADAPSATRYRPDRDTWIVSLKTGLD